MMAMVIEPKLVTADLLDEACDVWRGILPRISADSAFDTPSDVTTALSAEPPFEGWRL